MTGTATQRLAAFAAELTYDRLPSAIVELAKQLTLDTLGTALAATTLGAGCAEFANVMQALGGTPESSILGRVQRVSALHAASANGAFAHALNFDAIGAEAGHTGVVCFAAPFALAQARAPVSGRRFLTAVIVASEVTARLMRAAQRGGGHLSARVLGGQYFGYLGAAAGAGHLLALSAAQMHSAFGLALMQSAGSRQIVIGGDPPAKAIYGAFPNAGGVLAALLAHAGLEAEIDALDGTAGVFGIATGGRYDAAALTDDLGVAFALGDVQFKPWPVSAHVLPFIEAALELRAAHGVPDAEIETIELTGAPAIRDWFEPLDERRRPSNAAAAANSAPFAVAHAFVHGTVALAAFTPAGLRDAVVAQVAGRIGYRLEPGCAGGSVAVTLRDGRRVEARIETPLGDPARPLTRERLEAKFRDCCAHAPFLADGAPAAIVALIERFETVDDVARLSTLLAVHAPA